MNDLNWVEFTKLNRKEKLEILKWRNTKSIRVNMFNSDLIDEKAHLEFIDSLTYDLSKRYFLVYKEEKHIGVVYTTNININNHTAEGGLYLNPDYFYLNYGSALMTTLIHICTGILNLKKLYLIVKKSNIKALNLYQRFGFNIEGEKDDCYITGKVL